MTDFGKEVRIRVCDRCSLEEKEFTGVECKLKDQKQESSQEDDPANWWKRN